MKNWMRIFKMTPGDFWKTPVLYYIHIRCNVNSTKLTGGGTDKSNDRYRKTDNLIFKLHRVTSRRSQRIHKKRNYPPYIFRYILNIRTRFTRQRRFFYVTKIHHTNTINTPGKCVSSFIIQHNEKYHRVRQGSRIGRMIWKLPESDIHANLPSINGPLTTTNTSGNVKYSGKKNHNGTGKKNPEQ